MTSLTIYILSHCPGCQEACRLAELARSRYPSLCVEVVDLDANPGARPDSVFAVPSYVLDGRLTYLGNPSEDDLCARLNATAAQGKETSP